MPPKFRYLPAAKGAIGQAHPGPEPDESESSAAEPAIVKNKSKKKQKDDPKLYLFLSGFDEVFCFDLQGITKEDFQFFRARSAAEVATAVHRKQLISCMNTNFFLFFFSIQIQCFSFSLLDRGQCDDV